MTLQLQEAVSISVRYMCLQDTDVYISEIEVSRRCRCVPDTRIFVREIHVQRLVHVHLRATFVHVLHQHADPTRHTLLRCMHEIGEILV